MNKALGIRDDKTFRRTWGGGMRFEGKKLFDPF